MKRYEIKFPVRRKGTTDFVGKGYVTLYDTCLVVSGSVLRFRIFFVDYLLRFLLGVPTYRTVPYGSVVEYTAARSLRHGESFRLLSFVHRIRYRPPSEEPAAIQFTAVRKEDAESLAAALNDCIAATKALFER